MPFDDGFPPLRLREVVLVLLLVAAGATAVAVKVVTDHAPKPKGSVAKRLASGRGSYGIAFPPHTTLARAQEITLRPFPKDVRRVFYSTTAYCVTEVMTSLELERRSPSGVVGIEFLSAAPTAKSLPLLDVHEIRRALVVSVDSTQSQPSC